MEITDNLIDLLIQVVHNIGKRAENKIDQKLLEDLKLVHGKTGLLFKLAEVAVEQPEGIIKDVLGDFRRMFYPLKVKSRHYFSY